METRNSNDIALITAAPLTAGAGGIRVMTRKYRATKRARTRGNKYAMCPCGSREPWANCCGKPKAADDYATER